MYVRKHLEVFYYKKIIHDKRQATVSNLKLIIFQQLNIVKCFIALTPHQFANNYMFPLLNGITRSTLRRGHTIHSTNNHSN